MKRIHIRGRQAVCLIVGMFVASVVCAQDPVAILEAVDKNISAESRIAETTMVVHGKRNNRTMTAKSYAEGTSRSFSEYLSPARDKGTKMLKLEKELWLYSPSTDRTILISGHLLRQSVMGSDLSYEDMMDDRKLQETYHATLTDTEEIDGRRCWVLTLKAKVDDVAYDSQKMWVDSERFVPLRQELFAKSGQMLKRITLSDVRQIDGRWFPMQMNYKDVLKEGNGTDYIITKIEFNKPIPAFVFSKAGLKQ
ncbi:outer membrane lipoprotein-sorting protein [Parabacteroides sp. OttesenSCG-928-G06]|nr:outer membrane lipoprotein-sorting protein [Parabacteroides sp. OttesenSCG-928-G06]